MQCVRELARSRKSERSKTIGKMSDEMLLQDMLYFLTEGKPKLGTPIKQCKTYNIDENGALIGFVEEEGGTPGGAVCAAVPGAVDGSGASDDHADGEQGQENKRVVDGRLENKDGTSGGAVRAVVPGAFGDPGASGSGTHAAVGEPGVLQEMDDNLPHKEAPFQNGHPEEDGAARLAQPSAIDGSGDSGSGSHADGEGINPISARAPPANAHRARRRDEDGFGDGCVAITKRVCPNLDLVQMVQGWASKDLLERVHNLSDSVRNLMEKEKGEIAWLYEFYVNQVKLADMLKEYLLRQEVQDIMAAQMTRREQMNWIYKEVDAMNKDLMSLFAHWGEELVPRCMKLINYISRRQDRDGTVPLEAIDDDEWEQNALDMITSRVRFFRRATASHNRIKDLSEEVYGITASENKDVPALGEIFKNLMTKGI